MSYEITDEKKMERLTVFMEKAKADGSISEGDVKATLMELDLESQEDSINEMLESSGVEIISISDPEDFEMVNLEPEEEEEIEEIVSEVAEEDLEELSKNVAVDDPVRMYLKEIG
ncbi:MAG TPA: hypothetical protein PL035_05735, partial [Bacillota bacterium]|nr:hypothetical protein [Bacillota bacterium]